MKYILETDAPISDIMKSFILSVKGNANIISLKEVEEIDEVRLSELATEGTTFILDTAIREKVIGQECYKIGFRKAVEIYGKEK